MLARGDGVSVWRQIADALETEISQGHLEPGTRLPTEAALADRFGVNRHTLRQAVKELTRRGLVRAVQGSGTYVEARPLSYPIGARVRFSEIVGAQARAPSGKLIADWIAPLDAPLAEALKLAEGTPALFLETLRTADGVPVSYAKSALPLDRFKDASAIIAATSSFTAVFKAGGVTDYRRAWSRIGATLADARDAARLDVAVGRPILEIEGLNVDETETPIQWAVARFVGDRVKVTVEG